MANPNDVGQLLTTTLNNYKPEIISNILNNHPLLSRLQAKGNIIKETGGVNFQEKISYASNGTIQSQGEYDAFNITPQDVLATATFAQKIISGTMTMTDLEMKQNSGKEAFINLAEAKKKVLIESLKNYLGSQIYADGTGSGGKEIGGLQLLIADAPTTGTVGAINRANYSVWQNKLYDFSVEGPTASALTIQAAFNKLWTRCQAQAGELPDLIAADSVYFEYFETSLQTNQRITDPSIGALGFSSYKYKNADVFYDPECPASHAYFINTNHVFLKYLGKDLLEVGETMRPVQQNCYVTPIVFTGNMTIDNARVHGVMHA